MWERFSYYGMRALLVLYMTKYLLLNGRAENVAGLATLKRILEAVFGPLDSQPFSSQIYGLYTALVYLTPIFGGLIADRVLGRRRTIMMGAATMAVGHFMMAFESLFLLALLFLIIGNGAFKPNISVQVGDLYAPGDSRRDRAFSIFYVGVNLGAFLAPLVCGTLGEGVGWHYGFAAAGIGMTIGLITYVAASPHLPPADTPRTGGVAALRPEEARRLAALAVLFLPVTLFWAIYEQQGNTIALWADDFTDRTLPFLHFEIPTTWFQAFNPLMIFAFTPPLLAFWARQSRRGREPSTVTKMAIGCLGLALAYAILILAAWYAGADKASWLWLLFYFIVLTVGELYISPIGLSLVSQVAPARFLSVTMGAWLATSFVGNFGAGWLGSFWSDMGKADFFALMSAIAFVASATIFAFRKPLESVLHTNGGAVR
ncbi:MAG: proton-dependent oligopeptide transporter, family [Methylobacteriaceae bacterium]|jgi:POT family proton-dependent oligopeptide transporter|nr:proton-dependent oligopeptide transporter, family [Methylobacteriaceae bacterium]